MNHAAKHHRRGSMLVEVLLVVSIGSVISAVGIAMIIRMYRIEKTITTTLQTNGVQRRMADEFRQDAHIATAAKLAQNNDADTTEIQFEKTPSETVVWTFEDNRLTRTVRVDDENERSDRFRLPEGTLVVFGLEQTDSPPYAVLHVERATGAKTSAAEIQARRDYQILAGIGRDHRFQSSANTEEDTP